jgi:hypothetical protein
MKNRTRLLAATTLTGLLLAATACASPQASAPNAAPVNAPASTAAASPSATATAKPSATAAATVAPAPIAAPAASKKVTAPAPAAPAPAPRQAAPMQTFTFPDGHISFTHPARWTVAVKPGPASNAEDQKVSFEATVKDGSGAVLARVYSGNYGDGASGPVKRTVLDHSPVSGIRDKSGEATQFGFAYDQSVNGSLYYFMDVRRAHEFLAPDGSSGSNQIMLKDRIMNAYVVLIDSPSTLAFSSPAAAKAWMGTGRYAQLKTMLLSLSYK